LEIKIMEFNLASCPYYDRAVEIIGRRWAGAVIRVMLAGRSRFSDIRNAIPGITDRVLSHRLRDLEADGLITRHIHDERPVRIEYRLTERGRALAAVVDAISTWANEWLTPDLEPAGVGSVSPQESLRRA
jgi:DNA-binding HxlR family transcriptional regulator